MTLLLPLLLACPVDTTVEGTAVGNPGKMGFASTGIPDDITLTGADLAVIAVELEPCEGDVERLQLDLLADLLGPSTWPIEVDAGSYCGVVAEIDGLTLAGETDGGTTFTALLEPDDLVLTEPFVVDGHALLLGIPLELDAEALEELGEEVDLVPEDPVAEDLAQDLSSGVALVLDADESGTIGAEDGPMEDAGGTAAYDSESSAGCGCSAGTGAVGALWLLPLWLTRRRRAPGHRPGAGGPPPG